jgi:hypothetical protein
MFVVKAYLPVNESFGKHDAVTFIGEVQCLCCMECVLKVYMLECNGSLFAVEILYCIHFPMEAFILFL